MYRNPIKIKSAPRPLVDGFMSTWTCDYIYDSRKALYDQNQNSPDSYQPLLKVNK